MQRELVDRILNLHAILSSRDSLMRSLEAGRTQIEAMAVRLESKFVGSKELARLRQHEQSFALANRRDIAELCDEVDEADARLRAALGWQTKLTRWTQAVKDLEGPPALPIDGTGDALREAGIGALLEEAATAIGGLGMSATRLIEQTAGVVEAYKSSEQAARVRLQERVSGQASVADVLGKRSSVAAKLKKAQEEKASYDEAVQELRTALKERQQEVAELRRTVAAIHTERANGTTGINQVLADHGGPAIRLGITEGSDTTRYDRWLQDVFRSVGQRWRSRDRIVPVLSREYGPLGTVQAMLSGDIPEGLQEADREMLVELLVPFPEDAGSGCVRVRPPVLASLLRCDECPEDDVVEVTLEKKPISNLSPGQRCSAMLPIIVLGSDVPLVIDQPEDNLDNQLITDLLIRTLQGLKERRQVIMATHNPNIVVSGDAEQVVVMKSEDGRCQEWQQGSVDQPHIMRAVIALMEGGRDAFRRRYRRYGFDEDTEFHSA